MIRLENLLKIFLQDVLTMSWRSLQNILKTFFKTLWRRFKDVLKTSWQDILKMSSKHLEDVLKRFLQDVLKTSWKRLESVLKACGQDEYIGLDQYVLETSSEDVRLSRTYSSWSRRMEDVFWRQRRKTSSRRLHQDECLLGRYFISKNNLLVFCC